MDYNDMNPQEKSERSQWGFLMGLITGTLVSLIIAGLLYAVFVPKEERQKEEREEDKEYEEEYQKIDSKQTVEVISVFDDEMADKVEEIEEILYELYYLGDIDKETMQDGMYKGMVDSLGDPYSVYYTEEELNELMEQTYGVYYGIGAYVGLDAVTGYPKIISPIEGAPAEEAGLRPDDIIYEVEGVSTQGKDINSVVAMIKGEEGTKVRLTIVLPG